MALITGKCLLRERLKEAGMTQSELARRLDFPRQWIHEFCEGRRVINLNVAMNISTILDIEIPDLFEWIEVPPSHLRSRQKNE